MKLWIARDMDGTLVLSNRLPYLPNTCYDFFFFGDDASIYYLDRNMFPNVTFENSPQEVELVLDNISESIVNEFMNTLNFTYDKSEKCMVAKVHNSDLTSLKNIIESNIYATRK